MDKSITYIKNLIVLAFSDGIIDSKELELLNEKAVKVGIELNELENWLNNAEELAISIPGSDEEREKQLIHMINISGSDGQFSQHEYDLCMLMAEKLPYSGLSYALKMKMNRSYLKNLVAVACSDGSVNHSEMLILQEAASNAGVSKEELGQLISKSGEFRYLIPESYEDRETQLIQMLTLALADSEFSEDEYNLCKMVAEKLDFTETELKLIIKLSFKGEITYNSTRTEV